MENDAARDALVQEARELIGTMEAALLHMESHGRSDEALNAILRAAHTIKGSAGLLGFDSIVSFTHVIESLLDKLRHDMAALDDKMILYALVDAIADFKEAQDPAPGVRGELEAALKRYLAQDKREHKSAPADAAVATDTQNLHPRKSQAQPCIKVEVAKLDQLIDLVGELVIADAGAALVARQKKDAQFDQAIQVVSGLVEQMREAALDLRMVQINQVFQRFPRVVRDLGREIGKNIELLVTGGETGIDKSLVEKIADPLVQLVRNAMAHGIESPALRRAAGKPEVGVLHLHARHESGMVLIEVSDDGEGLNREKILRKAIEKGWVAPNAQPSEQQLFKLIFAPGFSTAEQVTALSGRGVGMDVVRRNIEALRGQVDIFSRQGQGTVVRIRVPLTLAIIAGFQIAVGTVVFVIPLDLVVECLNFSDYPVQHNVMTLRDESLPLIRLCEFFDLPCQALSRQSLVVVQSGSVRLGLLVDHLLGECQAVIKPLGALLSKVKGLSGSTVLGDGRVALILDIPYLLGQSGTIKSL